GGEQLVRFGDQQRCTTHRRLEPGAHRTDHRAGRNGHLRRRPDDHLQRDRCGPRGRRTARQRLHLAGRPPSRRPRAPGSPGLQRQPIRLLRGARRSPHRQQRLLPHPPHRDRLRWAAACDLHRSPATDVPNRAGHRSRRAAAELGRPAPDHAVRGDLRRGCQAVDRSHLATDPGRQDL
ncbi:MAG: hypothetical protein AVDCRST_MAG61-1384, partial [uncultured Friedmanniella sp.]